MSLSERHATRMPRVAFFTDSFHESNGVALTSRQFAGFAKSHFYPFLAVHRGPESAHWIRGSYQTYELKMGGARLNVEHDLAFDLLFFRHLKRLETVLRNFQPDIVHVTGPGHVGLLGAILAYQLGVPLVASWHTNVHEFGARRLESLLTKWPSQIRKPAVALAERKSLDLILRFYRLAKMIFAPNPELCVMLGARCGRPVHSMQRGIDCELYHPGRRQSAKRPFTIGYVGRVSTEKNVRVLPAVENELRRRGLTDFTFHVIGEGSERPWLQQQMNTAVFHGLLKGNALANAYAQLDVLLFPSETDTFGNVVLEAAASGVPALVSGKGGPKFLLEEGVTGYICSRAEQYADAVMKLAGSGNCHETMRAAARASALSRSWDSVFSGIYLCYRDGIKQGLLPSTSATPSGLPSKEFHTRTVS